MKSFNEFPENQAREAVLKVLLIATTIVISLLFALLILSYFVDGNHYVAPRIVVSLLALAYLIVIDSIAKRYRQLASVLLVGLYALLASFGVWQWGIQAAFAILMMSLTITLAGILLGARFALYTGAAFIGVLLTVQTLVARNVHIPDASWQTGKPSEFGELGGHILLFGVLALVSWLFGRQIERSLHQTRQAEAAVVMQKKQLAQKLKERTQKLRASQLAEIQQLYRFAELGQFSTALFHDLSNHLSVLVLDLEGLKQSISQDALDQTNESIAYIDTLVAEVRQQLHHEEHPRQFNCIQQVESVIKNVKARFVKAGVEIITDYPSAIMSIQIYGDPIRFCQVITILLNNALDATIVAPSAGIKQVRLRLRLEHTKVVILVSDWGIGVPEKSRTKIFEPFYGTKKTGMGIGLFITRQIIETHFKGTIELTQLNQPTMLKVSIPHGSSSTDPTKS